MLASSEKTKTNKTGYLDEEHVFSGPTVNRLLWPQAEQETLACPVKVLIEPNKGQKTMNS